MTGRRAFILALGTFAVGTDAFVYFFEICGICKTHRRGSPISGKLPPHPAGGLPMRGTYISRR